ncbi:MAG: hypothetical protein ACXAEF_03640 [Candidatus Thorarchaeota archaeon]|jgi:hypothetical protein
METASEKFKHVFYILQPQNEQGVPKQMTLLGTMTEFTCRVCGQPLKFDITDDSTYITKTEHEDFFGMQLTTYRVSHDSKKERHYNSIVVDQMGFFRGHRDAYAEPLGMIDTTTDGTYWVFHEESPTIEHTENVALALLMSRTQRWVVDIVCPSGLNASETATLVLDRVEEASRVYDSFPQPMEMRIADMDLRTWASDDRVLCVSFTNHKLVDALGSVASYIITETSESFIPNRRILNLIFKILESNPNLKPTMLARLMNEDMLFTKLKTSFEDRIPSIVERTASRYPIANEILGPLLRGYMTLIEVLEEMATSRYEEVIDLVDFINRRKILG